MKTLEEKILEIIRTGRNFTQMAEDITAHLKEFIEWLLRQVKFHFNPKAKEDKLKYHREYMNAYRQQHKERVKAQKNLNRGVMPDVFIMECF